MADDTFEGKTQAEWLALRSKADKPIGFFPFPETEIQRALLWFEEKDKKARIEIEERRFQTQLNETRRQGSATRRIAWFALHWRLIGLTVDV